MAKMTTEEILGVFEEMSVLELKEFLDAFEEKFDVTAAAPVAVAAAPAGGGEAAGGDEAKDSFDVDKYINESKFLPQFLRCSIKENTAMYLLNKVHMPHG